MLLLSFAFAQSPVPSEAALAEHYLVILASKRDPAEPIPALAVIAAHPELGVTPQTLQSSRFKNLMPCYTVTIAGAYADKKAAYQASAALTKLSIDHYIKPAGAYVGTSAALDAWCQETADPQNTGWRFTYMESYLPLRIAEESLETLQSQATPPKRTHPPDSVVHTWEQSLNVAQAGDITHDQRLTVWSLSGTALSCQTDRYTILTAGLPHFGMMDTKTPACGDPTLVASLQCDQPLPSYALMGPPGSQLRSWGQATTPASDRTFALSQLQAKTGADWTQTGEDVERTVTAQRYQLGGRTVLLVTGLYTQGNPLCEGEGAFLVRVYPIQGDAPVATSGSWIERYGGEVLAVVDINGDDQPELVLRDFYEDLDLIGLDGTIWASQELAYCDCPC